MAETPRERQLREVLEHVLRFGRLEHRTDSSPYETCYDWCPRCIINRALRATPEPAPTEKTWKCLYCETVNPKHFKCCLVCHLAREKQDAAPTEHPELQLDPEVTEMLTEAIKRGAPEPQDTLESLPDSPSHWVKDRFLKAHPDTVRLLAKRAALLIWEDCLDRASLKHEFRQVDEGVKHNEVIPAWTRIIAAAIAAEQVKP
jgi:hypothetical protein